MLNNILMGVQIVLSVLLLLVIMPQEGKGNFSSDFSGAGDDFEAQAYFKPKGKQAFLLKTKFFLEEKTFDLLINIAQLSVHP